MKKSFKVKRLDKRHNGHGHMKYYVDVIYHENSIEVFYELKNWCIDQWGITRPFSDWAEGVIKGSTSGDLNPAWTYIRDEYRKRIMFRDKEEAALFTLRWGS